LWFFKLHFCCVMVKLDSMQIKFIVKVDFP
jgi:hypothetical protein